MKRKNAGAVALKTRSILLAAVAMALVISVCLVSCCAYVQRMLMRANEENAMDLARLVGSNFSITDAEVAYMKDLTFNEMETDPINQRLASVATGVSFTQPVISVYVVAPLGADEVKYTLDDTNAAFWDAPAGTPLGAVWLLNMAVDKGEAVFVEREDIYRYTVVTPELAEAFSLRETTGNHTNDEWGDVITGYTPLYTEEGTFVGMLGMDLDIQAYQTAVNHAMVAVISIFSVALLTLLGMLLWLYRRYARAKDAELDSKKKTQQLLERERGQLASILDNVPTGIFVYEWKEGCLRLVVANPAICKMLGIEPEAALGIQGEGIYQLTHSEDRQIVTDAAQALTEPGGTAEFEYRALNKHTGEYFWLSANGRGVVQSDGSQLIYISYMDVTQQHRAQLLQNELAVERKANEAKSAFLSTMSHDMRTPLNAIINLATLAQDDVGEPDKLAEDLDKIQISGSFLLGLINDILDMSKIESRSMTLQPSVYHYADFINYVDGIIVPLCQDKDIRFIWDKGCTSEDLWVDKTRFNQLFFNLLSNAVKYTDVGGTIWFSVTNNAISQGVLTCDFEIKDTGVGMSEAFQRRMFLPFEREDQSDIYAGTGLGLSIAKQIVELMHGAISARSVQGEGTTFFVHLSIPIATQKQVDAAAQRAPALRCLPDGRPSGGGHVLLAEDHPLNQEIAKRLLSKRGYTVETVDNGQAAVNAIAESEAWHFQAVLMDLRMPVMDGLSAAKAIRALSGDYAKTVPIIAMTANAYEEDVERSLAAGMNAHLSKPIDPNELYKTLAMFVH